MYHRALGGRFVIVGCCCCVVAEKEDEDEEADIGFLLFGNVTFGDVPCNADPVLDLLRRGT